MYMRCLPVGQLQANCYLIWDEDRHACAIDPGGEPERLSLFLSKEGLTLEAIFVTHGHFDHAEGVQGLSDATGAPAYCSSLVASVLGGADGCEAAGYTVPAVDLDKIMVLEDDARVSVGSFEVSVVATPGHSPGGLTFDVCGHLFCGDLIFYRSVGRTDFPGGDFQTLIASVVKLAQRYPRSTPIHPGHMQSTTLGDELAHNPFLSGIGIDG